MLYYNKNQYCNMYLSESKKKFNKEIMLCPVPVNFLINKLAEFI